MLFSKVTYNAPNHVIARVNHNTKELQINAKRFSRLSATQQRFVLSHEAAHLISDSRSEKIANKLANESMYSNFLDPITITAIASTAISLASGFDWNGLVNGNKYSQDGWHGMSANEKELFINSLLEAVFIEASKLNQVPADLFWGFMASYIHRDNENTLVKFLGSNQRIRTEIIPRYENQYGTNFYKKPGTGKQLFFWLTQPITLSIFGSVILLSVLYYYYKSKKNG